MMSLVVAVGSSHVVRILVACGLLFVAVIVLGAVLWYYRRRWLSYAESGEQTPWTFADLRDMLNNIKSSGTAILLVEHNVRLVMDVSDRVLVLKNGRKIADDSPEVVAKNPEVVQAYLGKEWKGAGN